MPIESRCPKCNRNYFVGEKFIGKEVICSSDSCGTRFMIEVEETETEVSAELTIEFADVLEEVVTIGDLNTPLGPVTALDSINFEEDRQDAKIELVPDPSESSRKPFWGIAKKVLGDATSRASNAGAAVTSKAASFGSSGVAKAAEVGKQTFVAASSAIDASGAKDAIKATASVVTGKLDEVSGKRLVELLEKKLSLQDSYNDVLATRLAEALDRISELEKQLKSLLSASSVQ